MDPSIGGLPLQKGASRTPTLVLCVHSNRGGLGGGQHRTFCLCSTSRRPPSGRRCRLWARVWWRRSAPTVAAFPPVGLTVLPIFASSVVLPYNLPELGSHILVDPSGSGRVLTWFEALTLAGVPHVARCWTDQRLPRSGWALSGCGMTHASARSIPARPCQRRTSSWSCRPAWPICRSSLARWCVRSTLTSATRSRVRRATSVAWPWPSKAGSWRSRPLPPSPKQ